MRTVIGLVLAGATASGALAADFRETTYGPYTVSEEVIVPRGPRYAVKTRHSTCESCPRANLPFNRLRKPWQAQLPFGGLRYCP
jgi:hypothetical protein